jgi:hypothetical protein
MPACLPVAHDLRAKAVPTTSQQPYRLPLPLPAAPRPVVELLHLPAYRTSYPCRRGRLLGELAGGLAAATLLTALCVRGACASGT